jgi:CYTH domain-containing protein
VLTGNLYKTEPGLNIRVNGKMVPVEDFYNQEQQTLIIPGVDYCDEFETMADPTWHEVVDREITQDRASIVAFLKRRRFLK